MLGLRLKKLGRILERDGKINKITARRGAMPKQGWTCDECGISGEVNYEEGDDVMTVYNKITDGHQQKSPQCEQPGGLLRIIK